MCNTLRTICGRVLQTIILILSGINSALLIGLSKDFAISTHERANVVIVFSFLLLMLAFLKLLITESFSLCCKYSFLPFSICCCNSKEFEMRSPKNIRSFWLSCADVSFDFVNALTLSYVGEAAPDTNIFVIVGTSIGFGSEALETISEFWQCYDGMHSLTLAIIEASIGLYQTFTSTHGELYVVFVSLWMYGAVSLASLYGLCQVKKAAKQQQERESAARSIEMTQTMN
eukprot:1035554_1